MFVGMPKPAPAVKILLILNVAVFLAQLLTRGTMTSLFAITLGTKWQLWRYVTFQFLHGGLWHIGLNMLGLYMLGSPLEQRWGTPRFVKFYLGCGVFAGLAYVLMAAWTRDIPSDMPLVGASGGVYAILLACAVLFPHFRLIFFLFPLPIRFAALIIFGFMVITVLGGLQTGQTSGQFWSDVAHLGGVIPAAIYIWVLPRLKQASNESRTRMREGAWQKKMQQQADQQKEIDRILEKIKQQGIGSLTSREKKTLQDATEQQRRSGR